MEYHSVDIRQAIRQLGTSINDGLDEETAVSRLKCYGKNITEFKKRSSVLGIFMGQFRDFMVLVLIAAAVISALAELYSGGTDFTDSAVIGVIVVFNAVIGTFQQIKADRALEALGRLSAPTARVVRGSREMSIAGEDLVPGDILILGAGDIVPADCRIIESSALKADESMLTGEVTGAEKQECVLPENTPLAERCNLLFMGTGVARGRARAVVTHTGRETELGGISRLLARSDDETPLQKKLGRLGRELGAGALMICVFIFCIGTLRGFSVFGMFMTAVSLAVAAIPEGLTAVVTIVLAIGVQKMAKRRAIVKKLPAVEALGNATVICTDKTGTVTENKMTLCHSDSDEALRLACLCCDADTERGEATELGIVRGAEERGIIKYELDSVEPRVYEIPFSSERRLMTTVHKSGNDYKAVCKGAAEAVLGICRGADRAGILKRADMLAEKGLRVLAVAKKLSSTVIKEERGFEFVGLIALSDRPRRGVKASVELCRDAGIRTIMLTGDNRVTAGAIAHEIGIDSPVISGDDIERADSAELKKMLEKCSVFARVTPEQKYRIVDILKKQGEVVAFAGDGINDAPSIKLADIGCAMGKNGTETARQAADIVLADDNFNTIASAVEEGRGIYENILKVIHFLLSSNIGEILVILLAVIMGFDVPLLPVQLLWVNLVTDSLPAAALGVDKAQKDIMQGRSVSGRLWQWRRIVPEGFMIGALALLAYAVGKVIFGGIDMGRTMCFCTLSISQLFHAFNMRTEKSLLTINIFGNLWLAGALLAGIALQWLVTVGGFREIFGTCALDAAGWACVFGLSVMPVVICEAEKRLGV